MKPYRFWWRQPTRSVIVLRRLLYVLNFTKLSMWLCTNRHMNKGYGGITKDFRESQKEQSKERLILISPFACTTLSCSGHLGDFKPTKWKALLMLSTAYCPQKQVSHKKWKRNHHYCHPQSVNMTHTDPLPSASSTQNVLQLFCWQLTDLT